MYDVTTMGELLIDFVPAGMTEEGFPILAANPGGAVANYACTVSKMGRSSRIIAKVGDDSFGKMLVRHLEQQRVCVDSVYQDNRYFTTLAFVTLDKDGERNFSFARKPGADMMLDRAELPPDLAQTRIFHFGTLSMTNNQTKQVTLEAVCRARQGGALISLDPNLRLPLWQSEEHARSTILEAISIADIVKLSKEELEFLYMDQLQDAAQKLLKSKPQLVFVTCAHKGSCYFRKDGLHGSVDGFFMQNTLDTTGAGDIFGGSIAFKILEYGIDIMQLQEEQLEQALRFANAAAALSTTHYGGIPSIPNIEEVNAILGQSL